MQVPAHVLMRRVGEEHVLLNLERETYYGLNPVGSRMIEIIDAGASLAQVVENLLEEFEVGRERLEADVRSLARELIANGLIQEAPAA